MSCLDRTSISSWSVALALALAGCSDDGLAPPLDTEASTGGVITGPAPNTDAADGETTPQGTLGSTGLDGDGTGSSTTSPGPSDSTDGGTTDGSGGTTSEPLPPMTCESAEQCMLVDNCCECGAYHMDDAIPECDLDCDQSMCAALGIPDIGVVCEDGLCGLETHDCSGVVACDSLPPDCPDGTLPEVGPDNGCWTGACIPVAACDPVQSCDDCIDTAACVVTQTQLGLFYSCRAVPDGCAGAPTCECMPPDTCAPPYDTCMDADGQLTCSCPAC